MFNKTTSYQFLKYGDIIASDPYIDSIPSEEVIVTDKHITTLHSYEKRVALEVKEGIALLVITSNVDDATIDEFVIHRLVLLNKGVYFNIVPLTPKAVIRQYLSSSAAPLEYELKEPINYQSIFPKVNIKEIYSYYYTVKESGYKFPGEKHRYYELTYIDNGTLYTNVEGVDYELSSGSIILYGPDQFHTQEVHGQKPCSYLTLMFDMDYDFPDAILNKSFQCHKELLECLNKFIFESNSQLPYYRELLLAYLKEIILMLLQFDYLKQAKPAKNPINQHYDDSLLDNIISYISENIYEPLTIEDVCSKFAISRSSLQNLFKNNLSLSPKKYINDLKLNKSKLLIKEKKYTITEISYMLGFNSIHYFSRKFTQKFNIAPSDYAKSIYDKN